LYEACGAYVARAIRHHHGSDALVPELANLLKRVKVQQMNNQLNRAHRAIMRRLLTREYIFGACLKPLVIPLAGAKGSLRVVTSPSTTRERARRKREPRAVQRDRMWAQAKQLSPETAGPPPANYAGTVGPVPVPATHDVVTEDFDPSLNALIAGASTHLRITPRNFRRDWLNRARPVLHLTQGLYQLMPEVKRRKDPAEDQRLVTRHFSPRRLLLQPEWVRGAVQSANRTLEWWPAQQRMFPALRAIDPSQFIRLSIDPPY
jgi:hypothetical protein